MRQKMLFPIAGWIHPQHKEIAQVMNERVSTVHFFYLHKTITLQRVALEFSRQHAFGGMADFIHTGLALN